MRSYLFRSIFENLAGYHSSCIHRAFAINFLHRHHVHLTELATIANRNTITKRLMADSFRNKHRHIVLSLSSKTISHNPIIKLSTVGTVLPCPPRPYFLPFYAATFFEGCCSKITGLFHHKDNSIIYKERCWVWVSFECVASVVVSHRLTWLTISLSQHLLNVCIAGFGGDSRR
jgi:hypothetical protein